MRIYCSFNWLKKRPPFYTTEDILGSIYMLCSEKNKEKIGRALYSK